MTDAIYHHRQARRADVIPPGLFPDERHPLAIAGCHFTRHGALTQIRAVSMFLLFLRYCRGEDIRPDLVWMRAFGFNCARVFGPLPSPPWALPDYGFAAFDFGRFDAFLTLLETYAILCHFSVGHEPGRDWRRFDAQLDEVARGHWCLVKERVNEPHVGAKPDPMTDFPAIGPPRPVLTSYGYYRELLDNQPGMPPTLDYGTVHTPRDSAWARKFRIAQEGQHGTGKPWWNDEPAKVVEPGFHYVGGKSDPLTTPREACWYAGGCYLWSSAFTYHCEAGKWGRAPRPGMLQYAVAEAIRDHVFVKIGPEWQTGEYNRGGNHDSPVNNVYTKQNQIWTYSSLHAHRALAIRFGDVPLRARNGWRIVDTWGPPRGAGTFAILER